MERISVRWLAASVAAILIAGCGGGGGGSAPPPPDTPPATLREAIAAAAARPENDSSTNASSAFSVLQNAGVPVASVASPLKVNFTVFSNGKVKTGLALSNLSVAVAKLIPGTNGDPDRWTSYVYRTETPPATVGPGGAPALSSAMQATTDPKQTDPALAATQLVYNEDGYYTYTFRTDILDPAKTNGVAFEPDRTHRIAIQLSYANDAGETVRVNPYYDVTFDASGKAVAVTDPTRTRKMTDVSSCNSCHERLALHGGGRVDTQFCVMCHNPGTTDANSGNVLNLATMVHKIHAGKLLKARLDANAGGEHYEIWGFQSSRHDYAEVGFPQDLRNCTKCHDGANPSTPQGDNWKTAVSMEACLTCHANKPGSEWHTRHSTFSQSINNSADPLSFTNQQCKDCHRVGSNIAPERVHWNQNEEHAAKYRMNLESATYDPATRKVTVKYFLSDPTNNGAAYDLSAPKFGSLRLYLAYQDMVGQGTAVPEWTASVNVNANRGTNDGSNKYTIAIDVPPETPTAVAAGTARVVSIGQVVEPKLQVKWATDPRPEVAPSQTVNVVVQHASMELALSGPLTPRRQVVATEKCNACHGALGTTSGSNTLANAFHGGARNTVEACVVCHTPNRMSSSTVMTNGLSLYESYQFKRMIHGIHGNSKRSAPFTHGNPVLGAFAKDGTLQAAGSFLADWKPRNFPSTVIAAGTPIAAGETFQTIAQLMDQAARQRGYQGDPIGIENYAAEVAYPGVGLHCTACHVNDSYKVDRGPLGSVVSQPAGAATDPRTWLVISPKAATCTACHDTPKAIAHVTSFGQATFGEAGATQAASWQRPETCADCHSPGGFKGVDIVHGLK